MNENEVTLGEIEKFYGLLDELERNLGGKCSLRDDNDSGLPETGVPGIYFFFEQGETRDGSGSGDRVVYVGVSKRLRRRLINHLKGDRVRSSFRNILGNALEGKDRNNQGYSLRAGDLEEAISKHIKTMSFLWVKVDDELDRKSIEKNAIGLLSSSACTAADPASPSWLGRDSRQERVRKSKLWNSHHVGSDFDPDLLKTLKKHIDRTVDP